MPVQVKSYRNQLNQSLVEAFEQTALAYNAQLRNALVTPRNWAPPNRVGPSFKTTYRKNGQIVIGNYRDIVDQRNLLRSQRVFRVNRFRFRWVWDGLGKTSAAHVHEGQKTGRKRVPGRRFTQVAAKSANLPKTFRRSFAQGGV